MAVAHKRTRDTLARVRRGDLSLENEQELQLLTDGLGPEARLRALREAAPKRGKKKV